MAMLGSILLLTSTAGIFAQDPLLHAGEDCFNECWKTPGFCENFCGAGNACCRRGDSDSDPSECKGPLTYLAAALSDGTGSIHECVKAAFLPGQAPVAVPSANDHVVEQAQCISYMSKKGCGWTNKHSCPGQKLGWDGEAVKDESIEYKCCCTNNLWTQDATQGEVMNADSGLVSTAQCGNYMATTGCGWTADNSCPGQPAGRNGLASDDRSLGYKCCCLNAMWKTGFVPASTTYDPNAFNVNHGMHVVADTNVGVPQATLAPDTNGVSVQFGRGDDHHHHNPDFMYNHKGVNVRVAKMSHVDPESKPDEHHGPIHNVLSRNDARSKRERCVAGICADLEEQEAIPTAAYGPGAGGVGSTGPGAETLPSYSVSVEGDLKDPSLDISKVSGANATHILEKGGTTTILPPAPKLAAKVAVVTGAPVANATAEAGSSSNSSENSFGENTLMIVLLILALCLVCACIAAGVGYMFMGKKKKRQTTDRENFLKNDFIERQPVYAESAQPGETEPMMKEEAQTVEMPALSAAPMQPTESFPVAQVQEAPITVAPLAPVAAGEAISFPGMPTIGQAAPAMTYQSYSMPQATSMYGNYATTSMVMQPTFQSQVLAPTYTSGVQLEQAPVMTVAPLTSFPQNTSQFFYQ